MSLAHRSTQTELMDLPETSATDYASALADLAKVNRVTFTHRPVIAWLDRMTAGLARGAALSILDVASGQGDLLRAIHRWGQRRGFVLSLSGIDLNPGSAVEAAAATPGGMEITWRTGDVFEYRPDPRPDLIVSSQFTHHLDDKQVVSFLCWLERHSRLGWCIADLHRHAFAYYGFPLLARAMLWHRIVRIDGTISIARSFRRTEWQAYLKQAGVTADITWAPMFRWCIGRRK